MASKRRRIIQNMQKAQERRQQNRSTAGRNGSLVPDLDAQKSEGDSESIAGPSAVSLDITARGRPLIIYRGYEHRQVRVDKTRNLKAYRCIKKKCKGRLHTDFDDKNVRIVSEHIHEPNFDAEYKRRRRTLLREMAQQGNVSPSQIIQKARDLEMQYHDVCETSKTSYAAERRYIQRYWNRQKQQEFANGASFLLRNQQAAARNNNVKVENDDEEEEEEEDEESVDNEASSAFQNVPSAQATEQFTQLLQMASNGASRGSGESALSVYLNLLLQQMLSNAAGSGSSNLPEADDSNPPSSSYQEHLSSFATEHTLTGGNGVDAAIQTMNDESGIRVRADDAAVRDALALELGTILAKNFWPEHYSREDKLKLMVDVIGKLLGRH